MLKMISILLIVLLFLSNASFSQGTWKTYSDELDAGKFMSGNLTLNFIEDQAGNLFLTTTKGNIIRYHDNNWKKYTYLVKSKTSIADWNPPVIDKETGCIWFTANSGVAMWNGSDIYLMTGLLDSNGRMIYSYGEQKKNRPLFSFEGINPIPFDDEEKLEKINEGDTTILDFISEAYNINSAIVDSKNRLWLGKYNGQLISREGAKWKRYKSLGYLVEEKMVKREPFSVNCIYEDSNGILWFLTNSGVITLKGEQFSFKKSLETANSIFEDSKKNIWIGYVSGITRFDGSNWELFEKDAGIDDVRLPGRILEDRAGNIWYLSKTILAIRKGGGLFKYDGNKWEAFKLEKKGYYSDLIIDKDGNLFCTTINGFYRLNGDNWETLKELNSFGKFYQEIYEAKNGDIWLGTSTVGGYIERYTP